MTLKDKLSPYVNIIKNVCGTQLIDPTLLSAIVLQESSGRQWATRYEPDYKWLYLPLTYKEKLGISTETEMVHQKTSWGLCQIMGGVARELGFDDHMPALCIPATNLFFGAKKISQLQFKYVSIENAIAAYNAGSPRKREDGTYVNQHYVTNVLKYMAEVKKINV